MVDGWCSAICGHEDFESRPRLLFACLRINYRRFNTIPEQTPFIHPHLSRMIPLVFSSGDEGVIGDFLCAWCPNPLTELPDVIVLHTGRLVDLAHLGSFGPRLQYLVFKTLGRMKHTDFEQVGLSKLIALLDRIGDEAMFRAPELRDLLLDVLDSPKGRKIFPLRYWRAAAELTARNCRSRLYRPRKDLICFLEAEGEWEKLTWWMGAIWASPLLGYVVGERMEDIVRSTELVVRHNPDAATVIQDLVKISSERALGLQHKDKLRGILEKRQDGTVDDCREGSSGIQ